jgi:hypothetical protein
MVVLGRTVQNKRRYKAFIESKQEKLTENRILGKRYSP